MTDDELKYIALAYADHERRSIQSLAQGCLALLAREASRGEVVEACPHCRSFDLRRSQTNAAYWICRSCDRMFIDADHWQRLPQPATEPA